MVHQYVIFFFISWLTSISSILLADPETPTDYVPSGPGFRVPFYVVSPWTRGGNVFTEPSDHNSQIMFLEQWAKAIGKEFTSAEMSPWRRSHMSNLVNMFDFSNVGDYCNFDCCNPIPN